MPNNPCARTQGELDGFMMKYAVTHPLFNEYFFKAVFKDDDSLDTGNLPRHIRKKINNQELVIGDELSRCITCGCTIAEHQYAVQPQPATPMEQSTTMPEAQLQSQHVTASMEKGGFKTPQKNHQQQSTPEAVTAQRWSKELTKHYKSQEIVVNPAPFGNIEPIGSAWPHLYHQLCSSGSYPHNRLLIMTMGYPSASLEDLLQIGGTLLDTSKKEWPLAFCPTMPTEVMLVLGHAKEDQYVLELHNGEMRGEHPSDPCTCPSNAGSSDTTPSTNSWSEPNKGETKTSLTDSNATSLSLVVPAVTCTTSGCRCTLLPKLIIAVNECCKHCDHPVTSHRELDSGTAQPSHEDTEKGGKQGGVGSREPSERTAGGGNNNALPAISNNSSSVTEAQISTLGYIDVLSTWLPDDVQPTRHPDDEPDLRQAEKEVDVETETFCGNTDSSGRYSAKTVATSVVAVLHGKNLSIDEVLEGYPTEKDVEAGLLKEEKEEAPENRKLMTKVGNILQGENFQGYWNLYQEQLRVTSREASKHQIKNN